MVSKLSVLIPSRNERFIVPTVNGILKSAAGDIEVIAVLDGYWPDPPLPDDPRIKIIHFGKPRGMRAGINAAAGIAKGEYLLKTDAHCLFAEGFDETLKSHCDVDWLAIPSRYSLDAENWCIEDNGKPRRDYHYLCYPFNKKDDVPGFHGVEWWERARQRKDNPAYDVDDEMSFQGSCWMCRTRYFREFIGPMSEEGYGTFSQEPQEIGLKVWLGGGCIVTVKKTWYAHLHKGSRYGRMYSISGNEIKRGHQYAVDYWLSNTWEKRVHDIEWLIERFWPVPTYPDNWREEFEKYRQGLASGKYYYPMAA